MKCGLGFFLTFEGYRAGRIRPKRQFWFPFSPIALKKSGRHKNPIYF